MKNLNADLKSGNFKQVYLLCGEEAYLKNGSGRHWSALRI